MAEVFKVGVLQDKQASDFCFLTGIIELEIVPLTVSAIIARPVVEIEGLRVIFAYFFVSLKVII